MTGAYRVGDGASATTILSDNEAGVSVAATGSSVEDGSDTGTFTIARTGSLAWAMGWHFAFDWGALWLWSGRNAGEYAPGRLFATVWPAGDRVTGGLLGPEASWFVLIVIAVLFAGFRFMYPAETHPDHVSPELLVRNATPVDV